MHSKTANSHTNYPELVRYFLYFAFHGTVLKCLNGNLTIICAMCSSFLLFYNSVHISVNTNILFHKNQMQDILSRFFFFFFFFFPSSDTFYNVECIYM